MAEDDNVRRMVAWMRAHLDPSSATGVCVVTVHLDRTGAFASMVMNCETMELYANATSRIQNYTSRKFGQFYLNYATGIDYNPTDASDDVESRPESPFCCDLIEPYKPISTERDSTFTKFIRSDGTENCIYKVLREVDGGQLKSTQYFTLADSVIRNVEVKNPQKLNKIHSYKNYKCETHKRFFAVDLYTKRGVYNKHHVRLFPNTTINQAVLDGFFTTP